MTGAEGALERQNSPPDFEPGRSDSEVSKFSLVGDRLSEVDLFVPIERVDGQPDCPAAGRRSAR